MSQTLEEIAKLAGVSRSTVSRVVNDQASVRPDVRARVLKVISDHHYQPHQAARSLVTRRTQAIGLIIPEVVVRLFQSIFFQQLMQGIAEVCNQRDYYLTLILATASSDRNRLYRRALRSGQFDGVILVSALLDDPILDMIAGSAVPCVLVGQRPKYPGILWVDVDNVTSSQEMTEYLISLKHKRIATITGPLYTTDGQDRLEGYRRALAGAGIAYDPALIAEGDWSEESGMRAMEQLLRAEPTCVFAASDVMAMGAIKALMRAGVFVPDHVSVAGYDDAPIAPLVDPPLTTMRQSVVEKGQRAAQMLISIINAPATPVPSQILPTQLVIRQSTAPLMAERAGYDGLAD